MFGSNENGDWVYLNKTPPVNTVGHIFFLYSFKKILFFLQKAILQSGAMNFVVAEHVNSVHSDQNISLSSTE